LNKSLYNDLNILLNICEHRAFCTITIEKGNIPLYLFFKNTKKGYLEPNTSQHHS
jgi:hypothetical protein